MLRKDGWRGFDDEIIEPTLNDFNTQWNEAQVRVRAHPMYSHFGIRNYRSCNGMGGCTFSCTITFKGRGVAEVRNDGDGFRDITYHLLLGKPAWNDLIEVAAQKYEGDSVVLDCLLTDAGV